MYFDAVVVFVTKSSLLLRLAVAILWAVVSEMVVGSGEQDRFFLDFFLFDARI